MTENILEFPKHRIVREYAGVLENDPTIGQAKERSRFNFAESVSDELINVLLNEMENFGMETESDTFLKDFSMTVDAMRATVYRTFGVPHPLHDFIDNNVKMIHRDTGEVIEVDKDN